MRADCDESDDADLIEAVMQRIRENGGWLVAHRKVWNAGAGYDPATFILTHTGPAPQRGEHDWIDIRNSIVQSGSMCSKCRKLRAENFDQ